MNFNKDRKHIQTELKNVLHDSVSVEEFEMRWNEIGEKYKLSEIPWFNNMWSLRKRWVHVYFKHEFWAGMANTQRSESMNNFFKAFVNLNTTLKEFVEQYTTAFRLPLYSYYIKIYPENFALRNTKKVDWKTKSFKFTN